MTDEQANELLAEFKEKINNSKSMLLSALDKADLEIRGAALRAETARESLIVSEIKINKKQLTLLDLQIEKEKLEIELLKKKLEKEG